MGEKFSKYFIIGTFIILYVMVSIISTIHVIDFFELSNPKWLAVTLAISFEVGAAASLASIIALKKMNKTIIWSLFFILTAMQAMGNTYYAYKNLVDFQMWSELFGLVDYEPIFQKRVMSIVSGAILPLVALGFIKSLVDYIRPEESEVKLTEEEPETKEGKEGSYFETNGYDLEKEDLENQVKRFENDMYDDYFDEGKYNDYFNDSYEEKNQELDIDYSDMINEELDEDLILDDETLISEYYNNKSDDREKNQPKETWDEDHGLDLVMNDMVSDLTDSDLDADLVEKPNKVDTDPYKKNKISDNIMVFKNNGDQ